MPVLTFDNLIYVKCDQTGYIECHLAYWIWRIIPIVLIAIGVTGNILNVAVLSRKNLRNNSTCIYFLFLAVSDTFVLCTGPLVQVARIMSGVDIYTLSAFLCSLSEWIIFTSGTISCWLIVLITAERTMVTLFPIKAKLKMTPQNAVLAAVAVVMFAAFLNGHLLYANVLTDININRTVINETKWKVVKSCVLRPGKYTDFYNATWGIILVITSSVVPISLIVTGNAIVGISLIKRKRALLGIAQTDRKSSNLPHQQSRKVFSTKIFFILCAVFVVSTVPYGIYIILLEYNKEVDEHTFARYQLTNILVRSLLWCNFSFNFLLYFMTGSLFKKEFKTMIDSVRGFLQSLIGRRSASPWTGTEERY